MLQMPKIEDPNQPDKPKTGGSNLKVFDDWYTGDKYRKNPNQFLDWYKDRINNKDYDWGPGNQLIGTQWGDKNQREVADLMAKEALPTLGLNDITGKYKDIYGQDGWYSEWLTPQLSRAQAQEVRGQGYQQDQFNAYKNQVMPDLAKSFREANKELRSRGLGSGGMAKGLAAKQNAAASMELARGKQDIANAAEARAQEIEKNYLNNAINMRNAQQSMQNQIYNNALQGYAQRKAAMKAVGGLVGTGIGLAIPGAGLAGGMIGSQIGSGLA